MYDRSDIDWDYSCNSARRFYYIFHWRTCSLKHHPYPHVSIMLNPSQLNANRYILESSAIIGWEHSRYGVVNQRSRHEIRIDSLNRWVISQESVLFTVFFRVVRYLAGLRPIHRINSDICGFAVRVGGRPLICHNWTRNKQQQQEFEHFDPRF